MTGKESGEAGVLDATRPEPGPTTEFTVARFAVSPRAAPRRASHGGPACGNIGGTQLGTFSGLFAAKHLFRSRDFSFCSLRQLGEAMLNAFIYLRNLERAMGIEPTTYSLGSCRSTTELRPRRQEDNEIRAAAASATIAARRGEAKSSYRLACWITP
jgi:hypothetical protein